jgi:hypothetical protein
MCVLSANRVRRVLGFFGPRFDLGYRANVVRSAGLTSHPDICSADQLPISDHISPGTAIARPRATLDTSNARW